MKTKRAVSLLLCALTLLTSTTFFGGVAVDPELKAAEDITRKIFNTNVKNEKHRERIGYFSAEYLSGLDGENDYILVNNTLGGYAIFDREGMELIEYSDKNASPYGQEREEIYYAGPTNYYRKENETVKHIHTKEKIEKAQMHDMAKNVKEGIKERRKDRKEKENKKNTEEDKKDIEIVPEETLLYADSSAEDLLSSSGEFNLLTANPGPTGAEIINADNYAVEARTYIENKEYFLRIQTYPDNLGFTCTTVATQILLCYNNWANDGRIIPVEFLQYDENNMTEEELYMLKAAPYDERLMMASFVYDETDVQFTLYEQLLEFIDQEKEGATFMEAYSGINRYLSEYASIARDEIVISYSDLETDSAINDSQTKVIEEIEADRPVMVSIYCYPLENGEYKVARHAVVAYGYQTILYQNQELDGIIANLGWGNEDTNHGWVNFDWVYGFLSFKTNHLHTDELFVEGECNNDSVEGETALPPPHVMICTTCERTAYNDAHYYSQYSQVSNDEWDEDYYHQKSCVCGKEVVEFHNLRYTSEDVYAHKVDCSECGYSKYKSHYYKYGDECFYCGYNNFLGE